MNAREALARIAVFGTFGLACSSPSTSSGPGTSGTTTATSTTSSSSIGLTTAVDMTTDGDEPGGFVTMPDGSCSVVGFGPCGYCVPSPTDCKDGWKCMPYANTDSGLWHGTGCFPVVPRPALIGEACRVEGTFASGRDDCEKGSMCLFVDDAGEGECVAMCGGNDLACPGDTECFFGFDGAVRVCVEPCDPLAPACSKGMCMPNGEVFLCFPQLGDLGPVGDACAPAGQCQELSACVRDDIWPCESAFCVCEPLCDLDAPDPDAPCPSSTTCSTWYPFGPAPDGLAHVGRCVAL